MTLDDLRRAAVARSLFPPTTLPRALDVLGFVQADPVRAPARAQDLTLRHRVTGYRAGDLERCYPRLDVHEDFFVNYGFVTGAVQALMHPRGGRAPWTAARGRHVRALLDFVRMHGSVHPREVDEHFSHGTVTNYWGGSSSATTHLLDAMHYRGLLRVMRREAGIRIYAAHEHEAGPRDAATRRAHLDALVDVIVRNHAPLPAASLSSLVRRLRFAVPQWARELERTLQRARRRLAFARVEGVDWYWPATPTFADAAPQDLVRLLAPFDPVVWDRRRFENPLGLGLSLRGVHAGGQAQARLLRAATPVARPCRRLGKRLAEERGASIGPRLRRVVPAAGSGVWSRARGRATSSAPISQSRRLTPRPRPPGRSC